MYAKYITTLVLSIWVGVLVSGCATAPKPNPDALQSADYGPPPGNPERQIKLAILGTLKDPESARIDFDPPAKAYFRKDLYQPLQYGWRVRVWVNEKNSLGDYTGARPRWFYFREDHIEFVETADMVPAKEWATH